MAKEKKSSFICFVRSTINTEWWNSWSHVVGMEALVFCDLSFFCFPHAAAAGAPGAETSAGAAGAPEEDGEPPHGAGAGEAAEGAEAAAAEEQGAGPGE